MSEQFWLSDEQVESLAPYFPRSRGKARADDRRVLSGILHVQRNGLRWCDAPAIYGRDCQEFRVRADRLSLITPLPG